MDVYACETCGAVIANNSDEAADWVGQPWPWHRAEEDCRALRLPNDDNRLDKDKFGADILLQSA